MKMNSTKHKVTNGTQENSIEKKEVNKKVKMFDSAAFMSVAASARFISNIVPKNTLDIGELIEELEGKINAVQSGDLNEMEAMLVGQAHALQTIFVGLLAKASAQINVEHQDLYFKLALKAQAQSRSTIQTLAEFKFPKQVAFVKQANISNGYQQVNNSGSARVTTREKESENNPNELIEANHGNTYLDTRTTEATIVKDNAMATVETKFRSQDE
jgi:hypothetical protein